ncbi:hypothetical protein K1719_041115 [Acacia pycnantha]|nr:hypothetical protein K1719_041115 [Acacia pycnantha]
MFVPVWNPFTGNESKWEEVLRLDWRKPEGEERTLTCSSKVSTSSWNTKEEQVRDLQKQRNGGDRGKKKMKATEKRNLGIHSYKEGKDFSMAIKAKLAKGMERTPIIKLLGRYITYQDLVTLDGGVVASERIFQPRWIWKHAKSDWHAPGEVVKIDYRTETMGRGKYARIAVLLEPTKPLVPWIKVDGMTYGIEYEGLPSSVSSVGDMATPGRNADREATNPT